MARDEISDGATTAEVTAIKEAAPAGRRRWNSGPDACAAAEEGAVHRSRRSPPVSVVAADPRDSLEAAEELAPDTALCW